MSIAITGATGELGTLVIRHLLEKCPQTESQPWSATWKKPQRFATSESGFATEITGNPNRFPMLLPEPPNSCLSQAPIRTTRSASYNTRMSSKPRGTPASRHMAYTGFAFAEQSAIPLAHVHLATEQAIRTTNIPYTFLRNALYTEVFVNPGLGAAIEQGTLITNTSNGKLNTVSRNDLARAAAAVLTEEGHENKTYNLVSDQLWNFDELTRIISDITGRQVTHRAVSLEEHRRILSDQGLPEPVVAMVTGVHNAVASGETSRTSADLRKLIGSPAPLNETVKQALQP